jgi:hypothetical protein
MDRQNTLSLWEARETFGEEAVNAVLTVPGLPNKYPELYRKLEDSSLLPGHIILPWELVNEMAGRPECLYDFWTGIDWRGIDGDTLYPSYRGKEPTPPVRNQRRVAPQQAIVEFGAYCMFEAIERGSGHKGTYSKREYLQD